jgi:coenzyme Q-binding protein COQ10
MKHIERHHSTHAPAQIFDLVADVERYPDFVPWVIAARVTRRRGRTIWTDLIMGTSLFRKQFTTVASLDRPERMEINSCDPMFERFEQIWTFEPAVDGGTNVEYRVDLRLKSHLLQALIGTSFADRAKAMVKAYMRQADRLYGTPQTSLRHKRQSLPGLP